MGSALPSRQSSVILPIITNRRRFSRTCSMISHSCWVLRASRGTSNVRMVSPACACANIASCWLLILLSPCSYSRKMVSAPAVFSSRTCLLISCLVSLVEQRAYPYVISKVGTHHSPELSAPLKPKRVHRPKRNPHTVRAKFAVS